MDIVQCINLEICNFIYKVNSDRRFSLVKKNSEALSTAGDFSFPTKCITWMKHLNISDSELSRLADEQQRLRLLSEGSPAEQCSVLNELVESSKAWKTPLVKCLVEVDRCLLFLQRLSSMQYAFDSVVALEPFLDKGSSNHRIFVKPCVDAHATDLNSYRTSLVASVLKNTAAYRFEVSSEPEACDLLVAVQSVRLKGVQTESNDCKTANVFCGNVTDDGHKLAAITKDEYVSMRSKDMQLMAMHKYGIRVKNEECFSKLINQLGEAASKVDLLEAKHTGPVSVKRNGQGCTKALLRTFEDHVRSGRYPELPAPESIDISLLKEEEEWNLIFNYILGFPNVISRALDGIENGKCAPHLLLQFIFGFVSTFSVYYRRVRVLLDGRDHLIPIIHARIHLVQCLRIVFNRILRIFSIEPVQYM